MHWLAWTALGVAAYGLFVIAVVRACGWVAAADRAAAGSRRRWELSGCHLRAVPTLEEELAALAEADGRALATR